MKTPSKQKQDHIIGKAIDQVAEKDQHQRKLDFLRIKDMVKLPICITDVHIDHGIEP